MKCAGWLTQTAVWLAACGVAIPQTSLAATAGQPQRTEAATVIDVALSADGELHGQLLDAQGGGIAGTTVHCVAKDKQVAQATTDGEGRFVLTGLRGGVYRVGTAQGGAVYRVWAPKTAPPGSHAQALLVSNGQVVRGQGGGGLVGFLTNPWVLAGLVGAAIAIPIALSNNDDDDGS